MPDPNDAAPHHPARRGGRDRQEHVRVRVRRRHRRHRLRAHVPRRGDVRHRPRRPRRHVPQGATAPRSRRSSSPTPTRTTSAACRTSCPEFPGVPVYARTLARGLLGNKIKEHKLHNNPLIALEPGDELQIGPFTVMPFRIGHSIPDAMGIALRTPVGTVVHTGDFKFDHTPVDGKLSDFHDPRPARRGGRALPPVRLDARREPGLHAVGADGRRGLPRDHGAARRPGHRGHLRQQHRPHPAGARRRRRHGPQGRGHRPLDGAELPDRDGPRLPQVRPVAASSPRTRSRTSRTTSSSSRRPAPRASRWPASPGWPTATTASSRSSPATRSSSAPARSRATRNTSRGPSTTCSRPARTSTTTRSSAPTSRATPARKSSSSCSG